GPARASPAGKIRSPTGAHSMDFRNRRPGPAIGDPARRPGNRAVAAARLTTRHCEKPTHDFYSDVLSKPSLRGTKRRSNIQTCFLTLDCFRRRAARHGGQVAALAMTAAESGALMIATGLCFGPDDLGPLSRPQS